MAELTVKPLDIPIVPITEINLSWGGFPSLTLVFSADSWDRNTPTAAKPKKGVIQFTCQYSSSKIVVVINLVQTSIQYDFDQSLANCARSTKN